jgi:hypothetical protein
MAGSPQALVTDDVNQDGKTDILFSEINPTINNGGGFGLVLGPIAPEVTPAISGALPAAVISGHKTPITQTLKLTNTSVSPVTGTETVNLALSTDASYSPDDMVIDSIVVRGKIGLGKTKTQRVKIPGVPAGVAPGNYFLVVQSSDPEGGLADASSSGTIDILAPQIDLSGGFKKVPASAHAGKHLTESITVINNGNVALTGTVPIVVDASLLNVLDDTADQLLSFSKKVNIKPGKSTTIQLSRLIAPSAANSYYLIIQLDPGNTLGDVNLGNNTFATGSVIAVS